MAGELMAVSWQERTLGEICDEVGGTIRTGPFGSQLHHGDYSDEGIPVVMPQHLIDGRIATGSIARVEVAHAERLSQHRLHAGDIVYGRRGDIGRRALVTEGESGWLCGTGCLRISLGSTVVDPKFLYCYLGDPAVVAWVSTQAIGATMPNLNTTIMRSVKVRYPGFRIQVKIASILTAYDDLIENNLRRIKILEEMAQSLYKEWFVDFRFPGHENVEMVDSPLGMIPEGWAARALTDVIDLDPSTPVDSDQSKPYVPMSCLTTDSLLVEPAGFRTGKAGSRFKNGDTLFARITPCLENGKTGLVQFLPSEEALAIGSTEFIVMRSIRVSAEFVYLTARRDDVRDLAVASMSGASGRQRVDSRCFQEFMIAEPPSAVGDLFGQVVGPMFRLVRALATANSRLRQTRDLLLPRLISGELDVSELDIDIREDAA